MKKRYALLLIIVGVIIGLGISVKFDWLDSISANNDYFVEDKTASTVYKDFSKPFVEAAKMVSPATVYIYTEKVIKTSGRSRNPFYDEDDPFRDFFGDEFFERFFGPGLKSPQREQPLKSLGSGIIVSPEGYIITNNHVVENADKIKIKINDTREYEAKLIGADKKSDIAILKIEGKDLPYAKLGDSDKLEVGEWIIAIGNPFGLSHTVTSGIISAIGRNNVGISDYEDFIQTDCSINPGNSGGPMINLNGRVIGINTAIFSKSGGNQGIGFAIPINMVKKIMTDLIENGGKVRRGYLGVSIQTVTDVIAEKYGLDKNRKGALIAQVFENSPAQKAGILENDIIIEFDGVEITDSNRLRNVVAAVQINKNVPVKVLRDGVEKTLNVTVIEQPENFDLASAGGMESGVPYSDKTLGLSVAALNSDLADQYGYSENMRGVVITDIKRGSIAEQNGLKRGDVILELDRIKITNVKDFNKAMDKNKKSNNLLIKLQRGEQRMILVLEK